MVANAIGTILGAGLSMFGSKKSAEDSSALQYQYQSKLNKQNYKYNTKLINVQNAFNERMMDKANAWNLDRWNESVGLANSAHQRQVADLKAAGLNPVLSANGGASVVNPIQSAQASSGNSQLSSSAGMPDADYMHGLNTASAIYQENRRVENELNNSRTNRDYTRKLANKTESDMEIAQANSAAEIRQINARTREIESNIQNQRRLTSAQVKHLVTQARLNDSNSAKSHQETMNLANEYNNYTVNHSFGIGPYFKVHWTTHPNQKSFFPGNSINSTYPKGSHYETIGGKRVRVYSY